MALIQILIILTTHKLLILNCLQCKFPKKIKTNDLFRLNLSLDLFFFIGKMVYASSFFSLSKQLQYVSELTQTVPVLVLVLVPVLVPCSCSSSVPALVQVSSETYCKKKKIVFPTLFCCLCKPLACINHRLKKKLYTHQGVFSIFYLKKSSSAY